jgi:hypothetical protein
MPMNQTQSQVCRFSSHRAELQTGYRKLNGGHMRMYKVQTRDPYHFFLGFSDEDRGANQHFLRLHLLSFGVSRTFTLAIKYLNPLSGFGKLISSLNIIAFHSKS